MAGSTDAKVITEVERREDKARSRRYGLIALICAAAPILAGGTAWATNLVNETAKVDMERQQAKLEATGMQDRIEANRQGIVYNRLLSIRLAQDLAQALAEGLGVPPKPLPTVELELAKALAALAVR